MKTPALLALASATLLTPAFSQTALTARSAPAPHDAGTYHVASGTWTRAASSTQSLIGPDVLYDNTCVSGYLFPLEHSTIVDEGRLPGTTGPAPHGCADNYRVDGFTFSYCTDQPSSTLGTFTHRFYSTYAACSSVVGVAPTAEIVVTGAPAAPALGTLSCWMMTVDLAGSGSFVLAANGGTGPTSTGLFGWSMSSTAAGNATGPLIAGDPTSCAVGAGTVFTGTPGPGTGLGTLDQFRIDVAPPGGTPVGCYFFNGNPFASFDLKLLGTACEPNPPQTLYCFGDGSGAACPCGNVSPVGANAGCRNTHHASGGKLRSFGTPSITSDALVLLGTDMTDGPCLYVQGTTRENGGSGVVFGDGLRCVSGTLVRLGTKQQSIADESQFPGLGSPPISVIGGVTAPGTRTYQGWYRNVAPFCTPAAFNQTNGVEVVWGA